jgi:hypothetical protein
MTDQIFLLGTRILAMLAVDGEKATLSLFKLESDRGFVTISTLKPWGVSLTLRDSAWVRSLLCLLKKACQDSAALYWSFERLHTNSESAEI